MQEYPRVLIVGSDLVGAPTGSGVTLAQLFAQWPRERLLQFCLDQPATNNTSSETPGAFHLGSRCIPLDHLVRKLVRRSGSKLLTGAPGNPALSLASGQHHSLNARIHQQARAIADISPVILPRSASRWVKEHKPDVIYTLLGSVRMMRLANKIAEQVRCPVVPHFMDDWPGIMYRDGQILGIARRVLDGELNDILARAPVGLCISQAMAQEYQRRYGRHFSDSMNCVEDTWLTNSDGQGSGAFNGSLRLVYCGGLHLGRGNVLALLAQAMQQANGDQKTSILSIFAPPADVRVHAPMFAGMPGVQMASLSPDAVAGELRRADVLVHVESFEPSNAAYTRYSISTKIPQYLACARPVLGIGPGELASLQHLKQSHAAIVVTEHDVRAIAAGLAQLQSEETRASLAVRGRAFAQANHSAVAVREALRRVLVDASAQGPIER